MASRKHVPFFKGKRLFKVVANKTNKKNIPFSKPMMRGGYHQ